MSVSLFLFTVILAVLLQRSNSLCAVSPLLLTAFNTFFRTNNLECSELFVGITLVSCVYSYESVRGVLKSPLCRRNREPFWVQIYEFIRWNNPGFIHLFVRIIRQNPPFSHEKTNQEAPTPSHNSSYTSSHCRKDKGRFARPSSRSS